MWNKLCSKINQILFDQKLGSKQWDSLLLSILNTAQIQRRSRIIKKTSVINVLCFGLRSYLVQVLSLDNKTERYLWLMDKERVT